MRERYSRDLMALGEHNYLSIDFIGGDLTIEEYLDQWLNASRSALRPKTAHQYEQTIQRHILPYIGDIKQKDLNLRKVEML